MTLGQKYNNPLCIKANDWNDRASWGENSRVCREDPWRGSTPEIMDLRGHAIFTEIRYGIRAAVYTLWKKSRNGKSTLASVCADWAPSSDTQGSIPGGKANDPKSYANYVAESLGIRAETPLDIFSRNGAINDYDRLISVIIFMSLYENAHWSPKVSDILLGLSDFQRDVVEAH